MEKWQWELAGHPDQAFSNYVLQGLEQSSEWVSGNSTSQAEYAVSSTAPKGSAGTEQGGAIPQARCHVVGGAL